jgi:serine protease inhibitor
MKNLILLFVASILLLSSACHKTKLPTEPQQIAVNNKTQQLIQNNNQFGLELFQTVLKNEDSTRNVMISPLSATLALSMTYNGAAGDTKSAFENTFHLNGLTDTEINQSMLDLSDALVSVDKLVQLNIANSIWYRNSFQVESDFLNTNKKYYHAEVAALDFNDPNSKNTINQWVDKQTNHKIPSIVDQVSPDDIMFLINAIYFKGDWKSEFKKADTENRPFYLENGQNIEVPTMSQETDMAYYNSDLFTAVDLPYGRGNFSMFLMLPNDGKTLSELEMALTQENWQSWIDNMGGPEKMTIRLPKFKFAYARPMKDDLISLGLGIAFSDTADFSKINSGGGLTISRVKQKTFIEVNEEGTTAAAATSVTVGVTSAGPGAIVNFDHPFLFAIKENTTGTILFIGRVMDPSQTGK